MYVYTFLLALYLSVCLHTQLSFFEFLSFVSFYYIIIFLLLLVKINNLFLDIIKYLGHKVFDGFLTTTILLSSLPTWREDPLQCHLSCVAGTEPLSPVPSLSGQYGKPLITLSRVRRVKYVFNFSQITSSQESIMDISLRLSVAMYVCLSVAL